MELSPAFQNSVIFTKLICDLDIWELVFEFENQSFVGARAGEMEQ